MLVSSKELIKKAGDGHYAVGCFNTSDLEITKAIIAAAEAQKSPVIIATTPKAIEYAGAEVLSAMIKKEAELSSVPVALHLDHGLTISLVNDCLELGYTSIMFDGSGSDFNDNIKLTKQAVDLSHDKKVPCEGELGHMKSTESKGSKTDPESVKEFIKKTGVDFLAVSVGSSHGISKDEKLDLKLLEEIAKEASVPLVLHGSSGVSDDDIKAAIKLGISKINVDTLIRQIFVEGLKKALEEKPDEKDPRTLLTKVIEEIRIEVEGRIMLFGSNDKA